MRLYCCNSAPVRERRYATSLFVCVCVYLSVFVCEHISGTAGPIFTKLFVQIRCGRGSVLLWRHCDTLCTSGFTDDVTFGRGRMAGVVILGRSPMSMNALLRIGLDNLQQHKAAS